jgi:hypothetical protein
MKTFSTYTIKIGKKDNERRVLYGYRQERYNVEFLIVNFELRSKAKNKTRLTVDG